MATSSTTRRRPTSSPSPGRPAPGPPGKSASRPTPRAGSAAARRASLSAELTLYLVHGWLHLAGHDDLAPAPGGAMRRAEARALKVLRGPQAHARFASDAPRQKPCSAGPRTAHAQGARTRLPASPHLRDAFFSGALLLAPLFVTVWAFASHRPDRRDLPAPLFLLPARAPSGPPQPDRRAGPPGDLIVIVLVTLLGYVSRDVFGRFFLGPPSAFMHGSPGWAPSTPR